VQFIFTIYNIEFTVRIYTVLYTFILHTGILYVDIGDYVNLS